MELAPTAAGAPTGSGGALEREDARRAVIWHDLECGGYRVDLPVWLELAGALEGFAPLLEVGAGTGRVTLALARRGYRLTALDHDPALLAALRERSAGLAVETELADARDFELGRRDYGLCVVPMQTLQLLGGAAGRLAFFQCARAHLRPGGTLACAVIERLESFDCAAEGLTPAADAARIGARLFRSEILAVRCETRAVRIERERIIAPAQRASDGSGGTHERYTIDLDHVSAAVLEREGAAAGLRPAARRQIPPTLEYAGSVVVVFHA